MRKKFCTMFGLISLVFFSVVSSGFAFCQGDTDCNGVVDGLDVANVAADFGATSCGTCDDVSSKIDELEARIDQLENLLKKVRLNDDENTFIFDGLNVQIVDGSGDTEGTVNGLGNLIVGYNEMRGNSSDDRSGSHNIVVGRRNSYSVWGGLVVGRDNTISGAYATVTAGVNNTASGNHSSVSGGTENVASAYNSSISGGYHNEASSNHASVSGGYSNNAKGEYSSVSGGYFSEANGQYSSVSGGQYNRATGQYASVSGGISNAANGLGSSISGGNSTYVDNLGNWRGGGCYFCEN